MTELKPGKYRHYKGKEYEVIGIAIHSETGESLVVYKMLYDSSTYQKGTLWVRPEKMFLEKIEVEGKWIERFSYLGN